MQFTTFPFSTLVVAALFAKAAALDFTINAGPTVAADFSLTVPTVTATYVTATNDGSDYDESFTTVVSDTCTETAFGGIAEHVAFDSSGTNQLVTVAKITDVGLAEVNGEIKYCHKLSAKDGFGNIMFKRDTIITIAIDITDVGFAFTGLSTTTTAVADGSTGGASGNGTTTAVVRPAAVGVGTTFTLTIANDAPTIDVSTVQTLKITPFGGSEEDWIVDGSIDGAFTGYLPTPVCDTANCILTFQLPFSYFENGGAMAIRGTVNLVTSNGMPSSIPSLDSSSMPTVVPSDAPSTGPSEAPSGVPSSAPKELHSAIPSALPSSSISPSDASSDLHSSRPSLSTAPSSASFAAPNLGPGERPSQVPSSVPSLVPSSMPTVSAEPSAAPSGVPSGAPTELRTAIPSALPSSSPSDAPSDLHSCGPSLSTSPSSAPSAVPSLCPCKRPRKTIRRVQDEAASAGEGSFEGRVGLIAAQEGGKDESSASRSAAGGALVTAYAVLAFAM